LEFALTVFMRTKVCASARPRGESEVESIGKLSRKFPLASVWGHR